MKKVHKELDPNYWKQVQSYRGRKRSVSGSSLRALTLFIADVTEIYEVSLVPQLIQPTTYGTVNR